MRQSRNNFVEGTFHNLEEFTQLILIMDKDIITSIKINGLYILVNSKKEIMYNYAFKRIKHILTDYNKLTLNVETIVTDQEKALINCISKYFPQSQRIGCLFHFKQDILKNLKSYGLNNKSNKKVSNFMLSKFGEWAFKFKGNIQYIENEYKKLIRNYPLYDNFINNYILKNHLDYFKDGSLNYKSIPKDCRSNSFLENYNGYIKQKLDKHRLVNWINFIEFIKQESIRTISKLLNAANIKLKSNNVYTKKKYTEKCHANRF